MSQSGRLPKFDRPPVVETAIGVEFTQIEQWSVPYYGLFWSRIRQKYPIARSHWIPVTEFPPPPVVAPLQVRCQFFTQSETELIQLQYDRLFCNWLKSNDTDEYPHYDKLAPSFEQAWAELIALLRDESIDMPTSKVCEVTYVNHLVKGEEWDSLSDLANAMAGWKFKGDSRSGPPEALSLQMVFPTDEGNGHLQIGLQNAVRSRDVREIVQLTVTARSNIAGDGEREVLLALDRAHEMAVKAFAEFTEGSLHEIWERRA